VSGVTVQRALPRLGQQLRELGLLVLEVDAAGSLRPEVRPRGDWLEELFVRSPLWRAALRAAAARWAAQEDLGGAEEVLPGCFAEALPRLDRRRRVGYAVAVIVSAAFVVGEELRAMCLAARMDPGLTRRRLEGLPPAAVADVPRIGALARRVLGDELRLAERQATLESVGQQLAESYEEMNLLYTTIQSMGEVDRPARFVRVVCGQLLETLPYAWIGAQLADDRDRLKRLAGELVLAGHPGRPLESLRGIARELMEHAGSEPLVLDPAHNPDHAGFTGLGCTALVHPVGRDEALLGILIAADRRGPDRAVSNVDIKLLGATAGVLGIFLENAALYEDLSSMFLGTLEALTASIDAKDPYTRGHSQRVAHLTQELARAVGLDEQTVGRMHIAGLVHDVGKIGVPESVLTKPGRLTEDEFLWIRRHPEIGYRILKDIPQMKDVLPGVLYHHERYDGRGYPQGLLGRDIPRVARLIALADAFDAMSSSRTYRPAMTRALILREIQDCSGTQFDPEFVGPFLELDFSEYDRMFAEHQAAGDVAQKTGRAA
jgi:HD-GYP domain-containing protein (c-di-GMP phosphodiesterase class II)